MRLPSPFLLVLLAAALAASGQAVPAPPAQTNQPYTLRATSRAVLLDVTVTDRDGKPVQHLPQSAFHVTDDQHPMTLTSFEEHTAASPSATSQPAPVSKAGVYSNAYRLHPPGVLNVVVLDISNISIVDQMYLYGQVIRFLENLPPGQSLAVYTRAGESAVLLQDFTSDRALLLAAVKKAVPRFPPSGAYYLTDLQILQQLFFDLNQLPGRKNVLWFSGGSTAFSFPSSYLDTSDPQWRQLYDDLEQSRIALYPIDARGLTVGSNFNLASQHSLMDEIAHATGGKAFYNNNGLEQVAQKITSDDGDYYTLTYAPSNVQFDDRWHKVNVTLDGSPYTLSYRRGYYADGALPGSPQPDSSRVRLAAGGVTFSSPVEEPAPIIFQARVVSAAQDPAPAPTQLANPPATAPKRGETLYTIHYLLPADEFSAEIQDGKPTFTIGAAAVAVARTGTTRAQDVQRFEVRVDAGNLREHPHAPIGIAQQIALPKGDTFLTLAVWDFKTHRLGSVQVPLDVPAAQKADKQ